jgi:hypothetical protein
MNVLHSLVCYVSVQLVIMWKINYGNDINRRNQTRFVLGFLTFFIEGPIADVTDAPQSWRLIVQPCDEGDEVFFLLFHFNGEPVEWNWQGKTEVLGEKPVPVPLSPPQI